MKPDANPDATTPPLPPPGPAAVAGDGGETKEKTSFADDFRRFFVNGLKALLPTLITLWLLFWVWNFLWENLGRHIIYAIKWTWVTLQSYDLVPFAAYEPPGELRRRLDEDSFAVRLLGVGLAIMIVYVVGVFVGNLIGRTMWRVAERTVMRLPLVRAIYPSVKQVTDFLLADHKSGQFSSSRVVAVQARHQGVWSIGLVTGHGYGPLNDAIRGNMITVFIPSSPTAVAGYVVVAHKDQVVELPLTVEEALRLLISGGVLVPNTTPKGFRPPTAGAALAPAEGDPVVTVPAGALPGDAVVVVPEPVDAPHAQSTGSGEGGATAA